MTGRTIWTCRWNAKRTGNTPAYDAENVYVSTRHPDAELLCIRADGSGDVTETHVIWRDRKAACDVPSPAVSGGRLYMPGDDGILQCLDAATGRLQWRRRLGGSMSSSPVIVNEWLCWGNETGTLFVVDLAGRGEKLNELQLPAGLFASPIVTENRMILRTTAGLSAYRISAESSAATESSAVRQVNHTDSE
jgi:outer membrane protein assembly factor BamB